MGAHPSGPSSCVRGGTERSLDAILSEQPSDELGEDIVSRYGANLPFLLKVLAAEQALSIQVHPDREQAERGFASEEAAGVPRNSPQRNYVDTWPKPEVLVALTDFEALAGFREVNDAVRMLHLLEVTGLEPVIAELKAGDEAARTRAFARVLEMPSEQLRPLVEAVTAACRRLSRGDDEDARSFAAAARMAGEHPGDAGVIASLLLQHLTLKPGEGLFMSAGGPHAYLHGAGVEIMGNSDNVLRAGLTHKHIDVPELLSVIDPTVNVPVLRPTADEHGVRSYCVPAPEFGLYSVDLTGDAVPLPGWGPRIVLVTEGSVTLTGANGGSVTASRGQSVFISASTGEVQVAKGGCGQIFVATPGVEAITPIQKRVDVAAPASLGGTGRRRTMEHRPAVALRG